jgi:superfamily II DNA or RNA helicase
MREALAQLCERLGRELDGALLAEPLDALLARGNVTQEALPVDTLGEEACELLRHAYEAGVATSLRDLARGAGFLGWVEETCSEREIAALTRGLGRLLGRGEDVASDDPARLGKIDEPPAERHAFVLWAERYGVSHRLFWPAREALADPELPAELALLDCVFGQDDSELAYRLDGGARRSEATRYLLAEARKNVALSVREALWQRRPEGPLRPLIERLVALIGDATPRALMNVRFSPARLVKLEAASGSCRATLPRALEAPIEVSVLLAGYEQRALHTTCSECATQPCLHARALAGRLLDACLLTDDRLHDALARFVARPSWQLFFARAESAAKSDAGEQLEISFALRVANQRISVGVRRRSQASSGSGRLVAPSSLLAREYVSDEDRGVLELLAPKSRTLSASYLAADSAVLRALGSHPRVTLDGGETPLLLVEDTLEVRAIEQADGLSLEVHLHDQPLAAGPREKGLDYLMRVDAGAGVLHFAVLTPSVRRLLEALASYRGVLPKESYPALASYLSSLDKVARVVRPPALLGFETPSPRRFLLRIAPLPDEGVEIALWMRPFPLSGLWPPGLGPELVQGVRDGETTHARRDLKWEKESAEAVLGELGCAEMLRVAPFRYRVESTQDALSLLTKLARLSDRIELEWAERARKLEVQGTISAGDLKVDLFKRGAFFFPEGQAQTGEARVAFGELLMAARLNERFVRVGDGSWLEIESALFARLQDAQLCVLDVPRVPKLSSAASPFWLAQLGDVTAGGDAESRAFLAAAARHREPVALALPGALEAQLRSYQREGVRFLLGLTRWAPGACLLDEMGLGKTIQSIALLVARKEQGAAIVVCPTSLVDNWCRELVRFAPELSALSYRGKQRKAELAKLAKGAVLVVSYELLLRDRQAFEGRSFATQIIDEAQVVKNARTLKARALASLDVAFRVALTGTPVENRLADLWSLFHCIAPGLLGAWPRFRARFAVPIERYDNRERAATLKALVAPFMLRREKQQVLPELPARTEVVQLVALSAGERELYNAALSEARRAIGKHKRHDARRRVHILAELTRLRQLACHPRLVIDDASITGSSKLSAFLTLLDDVLPRGQRVLVFSQFVAHLSLVRDALAGRSIRQEPASSVPARPIRALWLDGATPAGERARLVERFQAGEAELFLISLKAGGTGLNLTAADYVVHLDPWWNPSAQDQASDRAHRIGQTRPVTIVKLVTENTIEERVLALHEHKRRLAATIVEPSGELSAAALPAYEALLDEGH